MDDSFEDEILLLLLLRRRRKRRMLRRTRTRDKTKILGAKYFQET